MTGIESHFVSLLIQSEKFIAKPVPEESISKLVAADENLMVIGMAGNLVCSFFLEFFFKQFEVFDDLLGSGIFALAVILDRRTVLVGRFDGGVVEVNVDTGCVVGDYGRLHEGTVYGIFQTVEQGIYEEEGKKYAWSVGFDGFVKKVSLETGVQGLLSKIDSGVQITAACMSHDSE